jgi:hypothetical protein
MKRRKVQFGKREEKSRHKRERWVHVLSPWDIKGGPCPFRRGLFLETRNRGQGRGWLILCSSFIHRSPKNTGVGYYASQRPEPVYIARVLCSFLGRELSTYRELRISPRVPGRTGKGGPARSPGEEPHAPSHAIWHFYTPHCHAFYLYLREVETSYRVLGCVNSDQGRRKTIENWRKR